MLERVFMVDITLDRVTWIRSSRFRFFILSQFGIIYLNKELFIRRDKGTNISTQTLCISDMLICWYADMLICWYADMLICWYADMLKCWYADMLICWYAEMLICWYADILICWNADMLICWYADMLICWYADMPDQIDKIWNIICLVVFQICRN